MSGRTTTAAPHPEVRTKVRDMLQSNPAFQQLPRELQTQIARDTVRVVDYMARPEGMPGHLIAAKAAAVDPYALGTMDGGPAPRTARAMSGSKEGEFKAQAAREGAAVAGLILEAVNFPSFVSGLIEGVFHAIVKSSIEQMEAYGQLVANVAKSLNDFRDENVSVNQGMDHLVDKFPDVFQLDIDTGSEDGSGGGPRVRLREDVDEDAALKKVNQSLPLDGKPVSSLDDDTIADQLVPAARTQLATSRQQLLATMVLMGINRIVVTDGKIAAKVIYDFKAQDNFKFQKSATQFDYAKDKYGRLQTTRSEQGQEATTQQDTTRTYDKDTGNLTQQRGGGYYTKGEYAYTDRPVMTLMSASNEKTDAALSTKASLAGVVEVNFKSDYLPLEKMADSFQIAQIQQASKPSAVRVTGGGAPASPPPPPAAAPPAAAAPSK